MGFVFCEIKSTFDKKGMENLNKNLLIIIVIELVTIWLIPFPFWTYSATVINLISIVFLLKYKPKNYIYSVIGLSVLFILPLVAVLYLMSKIQC